jgi:hypothetical protein
VVNHVATTATSWHYGSYTVCIPGRNGSAVLESLRPVRQTGSITLERTGARVHRPDTLFASGPEPLPAEFATVRGFRVASRCDDEDESIVELALQVRRTAPGPGAIDGLALRYRVGDKRYRDVWPGIYVVLCDPAPTAPRSRHRLLRYCNQ